MKGIKRCILPTSEEEYLSRIGQIIEAASKHGAEEAHVEAGSMNEYLTERQMFKRYGKTLVKRWESLKMVTPVYTGANTSSKRYLRSEVNKAKITDIILAHPITINKASTN